MVLWGPCQRLPFIWGDWAWSCRGRATLHNGGGEDCVCLTWHWGSCPVRTVNGQAQQSWPNKGTVNQSSHPTELRVWGWQATLTSRRVIPGGGTFSKGDGGGRRRSSFTVLEPAVAVWPLSFFLCFSQKLWPSRTLEKPCLWGINLTKKASGYKQSKERVEIDTS